MLIARRKAMYKRLESRLVTERVDDRMHVQISHPSPSLFICFLDPVDRAALVTKSDIQSCKLHRRYVVVTSTCFEISRCVFRTGTIASVGERKRQRYTRVRRGSRQLECFANDALCLSMIAGIRQNQSQHAVGFFRDRVHLDSAMKMILRLLEPSRIEVRVAECPPDRYGSGVELL
jgi:hypothetical protein